LTTTPRAELVSKPPGKPRRIIIRLTEREKTQSSSVLSQVREELKKMGVAFRVNTEA
jgi:hypothetical protein